MINVPVPQRFEGSVVVPVPQILKDVVEVGSLFPHEQNFREDFETGSRRSHSTSCHRYASGPDFSRFTSYRRCASGSEFYKKVEAAELFPHEQLSESMCEQKLNALPRDVRANSRSAQDLRRFGSAVLTPPGSRCTSWICKFQERIGVSLNKMLMYRCLCSSLLHAPMTNSFFHMLALLNATWNRSCGRRLHRPRQSLFALFWHATNCASAPQCVLGLISTMFQQRRSSS